MIQPPCVCINKGTKSGIPGGPGPELDVPWGPGAKSVVPEDNNHRPSSGREQAGRSFGSCYCTVTGKRTIFKSK